jgi:serum/glucocorticoid-regulated kinase 2
MLAVKQASHLLELPLFPWPPSFLSLISISSPSTLLLLTFSTHSYPFSILALHSELMKDNGLSTNRAPSSSSTIDRSATPTPSNPQSSNPLASSTGAPISRSGLLTIRVIDARGLSLPNGTPIPPAVSKAIASQGGGGASSLSNAFNKQNNGGSGSTGNGQSSGGKDNRQSLQRKQQWYLPYLVLEFDKNEVLIDALGGDLGAPTWMYKAHL